MDPKKERDMQKPGYFALYNALPEPLQQYCVRCVFYFAIILAIMIAGLFAFKDPRMCLLLIIAFIAIWPAFQVPEKYATGKIVGHTMALKKVSRKLGSERTHLYLLDMEEGETGKVRDYWIDLPKRKAKDFLEECIYMVYYDVSKPERIISWEIIGFNQEKSSEK